MVSEQLDEEAIFQTARRIDSPDARVEYLRNACGGDQGLLNRVMTLLRTFAENESFLESPPPGIDATIGSNSVSEGPGTVIGPYKLLQQIGEGGMGVVFMAEQTVPIQRTVALKIIKPGMDTRQVIARFEAERQALAMMDHPNIAKVLDAGSTDTGRPYFVMELVKGVPITKYCDEKQLSLRERLELFKPVCEAVQHAHQKGIIHRDLKPTNVLVAEYDNRAVPKVIDFGVAKATAQKLTERTMFTEFGQVIGTVEYMSPEQAKLNQLDIDTRSDIYSLGVLLYELFAGSTPFDRERLREAAFDEVLRIIREEEPPKPSTRLSSLSRTGEPSRTPSSSLPLAERVGEGLPSSLASIAANRHIEPARLSKEVSGELDWIVMKCLEKDRNRRYETTSGLAADIESYLKNEPLSACAPSAAYRLKKFIRRNKVAVLAASAVVLALVVGATMSIWQAVRATRAESLAVSRLQSETQARKEAEAVTEFLVTAFESPDPLQIGRNVTVAEVLNRAERRIDDLSEQPLTQAALLLAIGRSRVGLGAWQQAFAPLKRALELRTANLGPAHPNTLQAKSSLANAYGTVHRPDDAMRLYDEILQVAPREIGSEDPVTLSAMHGLGVSYRELQRVDDAIPILEQAVAGRRKTLGPRHPNTLSSIEQLAIVYLEAQRFDEAISLLEDLVSFKRHKYGPENARTIHVMSTLAVAYQKKGRYDESIKLYEETLAAKRKIFGDDHPITANDIVNLGFSIGDKAEMLRNAGCAEDAQKLIDKEVADNLAIGRFSTAFIVARSSRDVEQLSSFIQTAIRQDEKAASTGMDALVLGELRIVAGKADDAVRAIRSAVDRATQPYFACKSLGWALLAQGRPQEAKEALERALSTCRRDDGTYDFKGANQDELTAAYLLDAITQEAYVNRLKEKTNYAYFPWFYIGQRKEIEGHPKEAIAAYARCVELCSDTFSSLYSLARWRLSKLDPSRVYESSSLNTDKPTKVTAPTTNP